MKTHFAWFIAMLVVASATGYGASTFTRESITAAQLGTNVYEAEVYDLILTYLDNGQIDRAKHLTREMKNVSTGSIRHILPILEAGHFPIVTQRFITIGKKYLESPNKPSVPTR